MKLLIVEDESSLRELLARALRKEQYVVETASTYAEASDKLAAYSYDCILLDIMLPDGNGLQLLERLRRADKRENVIIISARDSLEDKVLGLKEGADDYLPKPFAASEFLARVRALTRRSSSYASSMLSFGNVTLDCSQYLVKTALGEARLNNKEYQLMELFFRHPRQVFSSEHLMEKVWGLDSEAEMDVVWTYIGFLRRKLKQIGAEIEIRTIRGAGYALEEMRC